VDEYPVALFAYDRPQQVTQTLEALSRTGASELFVFIDGPKHAEDQAGVAAVVEIVRSFQWPGERTVVARDVNLGLSRSITSGIQQVLDSREHVIVIEDDICVAPEFYAYMRSCLRHYEHNPRIFSVTGLRYPFSKPRERRYPYDVFLSHRFSSWAWGTWRRAWEEISFSPGSDRRALKEVIDAGRAGLAGADFPPMAKGYLAGTIEDSWAVPLAAQLLTKDLLTVFPMWNMVVNTGFHEGTHFSRPPPWSLEWERSEEQPTSVLGSLRFPPSDERSLPEVRQLSFLRGHRPSLTRRGFSKLRRILKGPTGP
jgi:hypothetical protein